MNPALREMEKMGYIKGRRHPAGLPLTLYDYTILCQMDEAWNDVTMMTRGLVVHDDGRIIARPLDKFFNVDERPETKMAAILQREHGLPEIAEKIDGSMIVSFFFEGLWYFCTRGSWESPQAKAAAGFMSGLGHPDGWDREMTYIWEYTAPWNRVVVPYSEEKMFLLGIRDPRTGKEKTYAEVALIAAEMGFPYAGYRVGSIADLDMRAGTGCKVEGFVCRWPSGFRAKMKYLDYKELHRIVTGFNTKSVWKMLANGQNLDLPPDNLPDEFYDWFVKTRDALKAKHSALADKVQEIFSSTNLTQSRKDIALGWQVHEPCIKASLFAKLDNRFYDMILWKAIEPEGADGWFGGDRDAGTGA